ncbi:MAG: thiamine pyrophosphate-binding protein, partial [Candidatus Binatia bacterium]|nr:thiamine pyrophosphate-binding protein [Candidatus Binatia bacterium]
RPGPVYLGLPTDLQGASIQSDAPLPSWSQPSSPSMDPESLERTAEALILSRAPVMLIGTGVYWAGAEREVQELAELLNIPVATSYTAKGLFPDHHPLALGCLGSGGRSYARENYSKADLILALGTTFSEGTMLSFEYKLIPRSAKIIHIDIDPQELGRNFAQYQSVQSDAKVALQSLLGTIKNRVPSCGSSTTKARAQEIENKKKAWRQEQETSGEPGKITKPNVYRTLSDLSTDTHVFVTAGVTGSLLTHIDARQPVIHAGEFRAIGTALATALGAKLGQPDKRVVCVTGDGSFLMEQQELATARLHNIPILVVVLRNNAYGGMKRDQIKHYNGRVMGTDLFIPDLHDLAGLYGAQGEKVAKAQDLRPVLEKHMSSDELVVVDVELGA